MEVVNIDRDICGQYYYKYNYHGVIMSELVWGIKNGDLDQVRDIVEKKVVIDYTTV